MLRCIRRYSSAKRGISVVPGEVLRDLSPAQEADLLRDGRGDFEVVSETVKALDAPPRDKMMKREGARRKAK